MKTFPFIVLALFLSAAAGASTITGTVTSAGTPLSSMTVDAYGSDGTIKASGQTTFSGSYALTLPAGTYRLLAYDPNGVYATSFYDNASSFETSAPVTVATSTVTVNFSLVLAGHISGHITAAVSGAPLANMTVAAYNLDGTRRAFTSSDAAGAYDLTLPPGTFKLAAFDTTLVYAAAFYANQNSFTNATALIVAAGQRTTADISLDLAAKLSGRITAQENGAPLSGITVASFNADGSVRSFTSTDSAGDYVLAVPTGDFRIGAYDPSLVYLTQFYSIAPGFGSATVIHAVAPQTVGALNIALAKGARVTGQVVDRNSANALSGITIGAYDAYGHLIASATTDAVGSYAMLLSPATYKLLAFDPTLQYATAYYANAATFDASSALPLTSGQSLNAGFSLTLAGRISGTVTDAAGRGIAATVIAYDMNGFPAASTVAGADGTFRLALVPGSYRIAATDPNHTYATVFYGSATTFAGATSITIAAAQEFSGVALRMHVVSAAEPIRRRAVKH
jgi:5-hydroxyisourate hydrolase-like protein (transthyretin family)